MNTKLLALMYFPSVIYIAEDEPEFLTDLLSCLYSSSLSGVGSIKPLEILKKMSKSVSVESCFEDCIQPDALSENIKFNHQLSVNVSELYKLVYSQERYLSPTVLLTDYNMQPNADEFITKMHENKFYPNVILLTGFAGQEEAIKMLENGLIHRYLVKDEQNLGDELPEIIKEQQLKYFQKVSQPIIQSLIKETKYADYLSNPVFAKNFYNLIKQNDVIEWYPVDNEGGFLFITSANKLLLLITQSTERQNDFIHLADDQEVPSRVLELLKDRKKMLFMLNKDNWMADPEDWVNFIHDANEIPDLPGVYQSLVTDLSFYDFKPKKIKFLSDFIATQKSKF